MFLADVEIEGFEGTVRYISIFPLVSLPSHVI